MNTVIIATNLGHLKAFRMGETLEGTRRLDLIQEMVFPEAHEKMQARVTDTAGRFPISDGTGLSLAQGESMKGELELQRRLMKLIASQMENVLNTERPEYWHFAAAPAIHQALLNELPDDLRLRAVRNVQADLTKTPAPELLARFAPVKAA